MQTPEQHQAAAEREVYLAEVTRQLSERLSALETYESVEELRDHVNAMAAAHEELGVEALLAMRSSLEKFGSARQLGSTLAEAAGPHTSTPLPCHANQPWWNVRISIPFGLVLTLFASWAAAFCLLEMTDLWFAYAFNGRTSGAAVVLGLSFVAACVVSPKAWVLSRWSSVAVGGLLAFAVNAALGLTIYPTYASLGETVQLAHIAVSITVSTFILGVVTSESAKKLKASTPPTHPGSVRNIRVG